MQNPLAMTLVEFGQHWSTENNSLSDVSYFEHVCFWYAIIVDSGFLGFLS